jgi:hypothetical protein
VFKPFTYTMPGRCQRGRNCVGWQHVLQSIPRLGFEGVKEFPFEVEPCCGLTREEAQRRHDEVCGCTQV